MRRFWQDWDMSLVILAVGALTGLIAFMAFSTNPAACHRAVSHAHLSYVHVPVRSFIWVCAHP